MLRWSIVMLLVLAGCGGGGDEVTAPATEPGSSAATRRIDRPSGGPGGAFAPTAPPRPVERPSGAPDGPIVPAGYAGLPDAVRGEVPGAAHRDRRRLQKDGQIVVTDLAAFHLYRSAAQACLGQWDGAQRDFDKLTAEKPKFTGKCADAQECEPCKAAVLKWLTEP